MININQYYQTSDLALATAISLYIPLDSVDKSNPHKAEFLFRRSEDLNRLIELYWRKQLQVEPQQFFTQLKFIKSRLYSSE